MVVLAVAFPFQTLVDWLRRFPLVEWFTDSEPSDGGMALALLVVEPTDPAPAGIVGTVSTEPLMDLVDQPDCQFAEPHFARLPVDSQQIANSECIGPEIAFRRPVAGEAGRIGEREHQVLHSRRRGLTDHHAIP
ncbi:hypothetical protein [Candidatus Laterigemmans baculatus]|uniref:hypothetical protein n=1 Tax=Candidatus Laterigemmans baculatus TaxID=2770505 RepID=UPI0013DB503C|nr:hypothetical protein [Candidatus Laterigemmans baculatus]